MIIKKLLSACSLIVVAPSILLAASSMNMTECIEKKSTDACHYIGKSRELSGEYEEAKKYYSYSCLLGSGADCYNLGRLYQFGKGVSKSAEKSLKLYEKACAFGSAGGCNSIGNFYEYGIVVEKDLNMAVKFHRAACNMGSAAGCGALAWFYKKGIVVEKNLKNAVYYYRKSCKGKYGPACAGLAGLYITGEGTGTIDRIKSNMLFKMSCKYGFKKACKIVEYDKLIHKLLSN